MSKNNATLVTDIAIHTFVKLICIIKDIQKFLINKSVSRNNATLIMHKGVFKDQRSFKLKQFHRVEAKLKNFQVDENDEGDRRPRFLVSIANTR